MNKSEQTIKIIITDLTIISALKNKLIKEKSVLAPNPTACDADISFHI